MALIPEWRTRIERWQKKLSACFYRPLATVELSGYTTARQLSPDAAQRGRFRPMPEGTAWGAKWEYAWMRTSFALPDDAKGRRIVFQPGTGGETLVFVNGQAAGTASWGRAHIPLIRRARGGETYEVLMEAYAGHGPRVCGGGPCLHGEETVPEPAARQATVGESSFGIWEEEAYQLWLDVQTLLELRDNIDPDSLRVVDIDAALRDYTVLCDLELPRDEMLKSVRAARQRLAPLLACHNGSTAPALYCIGHAHIDVAWLWPLQEAERKACRTLSTQLALMREYPDYTFLQSTPHLYTVMQRLYPAEYRRVKQAVKQGRLVAEGGMWVEADTNVTGGEALVRQFLHGKRFFREEFGVDNRLLWLPDVFGYSAALPQILKGCGVSYFTTAKIFWNYNSGDPFPYNSFWWEGIDGTRVLAHFISGYNEQTSPRNLIGQWNNRAQKDTIRSRLVSYGHGDGGGGPTRNHIEFLQRQADLEGAPRSRMASPIDFFEALEKTAGELPAYVGELYLQLHRGTYTSQAKTKKLNRRSEYALRDEELWSAVAAASGGGAIPYDQLEEDWKTVLVNQFHDILPGSSIARVYEEAEASYQGVVERARAATVKAMRGLVARRRNAVTVFNSLSWRRRSLVTLPPHFKGAAAVDGTPLPVQACDGRLVADVPAVPACGWTTVRNADSAGCRVERPATGTAGTLENEFLRVKFNAAGEMESVYDKTTHRELTAGPCNAFRVYKDVPNQFDAWDIDISYKRVPVDVETAAKLTLMDNGPLFATLRIERRILDSHLTQFVTLRRGSRRIDFETTIDWQESHKLLKVNFPVNVRSDEAIHEIQFGHLSRPTHFSRQYDADRFEVPAHKWTALSEQNRGCAVLNDCKYGVNVEGNSINLTLLKSALAPDMRADKGMQEFTYSFYAWQGSFGDCGIVREGYELNLPIGRHPGDGGERSVFCVDCPNIVIEAVKPAEDRSGDIVVRLYEAKRMTTDCVLSSALPVASAAVTDMLEEHGQSLRVLKGGRLKLSFRPFEIKTVRLSLSSATEHI